MINQGVAMKNTYIIRQASTQDIPVLVTHHRLMFEEIYLLKGKAFEETEMEEMSLAYYRKLERRIIEGTCIAHVVEIQKKIVASAAISIVSKMPIPKDPTDKVGYLHSVYTDKKFRHKGFANQLIKSLISFCNSKGITRIELEASDAGQTLYEKLGFILLTDVMELWSL